MSSGKKTGVDQTTGSAPETELKFRVTPEALRRLAKHPAVAGAAKTQALKATYFDTPDLRLRKAGLSLRVRKEGARFIQTVKQSGGPAIFEREEWEEEVRSAKLDMAALAQTPVVHILGEGETLEPVFTSTVTRQSRTWTCDGAAIEVTVDKGALAAGAARAPVLEMELELKAGPPDALFELARQLFEAAPIRLSLLTKSDHGFALAGVERAKLGKAPATPLAPGMSISEAFKRIARSCLMQTDAASEALQREPSAEGVHQTRIGLRRLRTAMKIFKPAVDDVRSEWIEGEARWLAGELGDARSLDVFLEDAFAPASAAIGDAKTAARYGAQLNTARMAAYDKALAAVASERFAKALLEIAIWVENGDWRKNPDRAKLLCRPIGPFAAHALDGLRKRVKKRREVLAGTDAEMRHKLRIRAKRLRYATQFFEMAFGESSEKRRTQFTQALKALQDSLGKLNDIATADEAAMAALAGARSPALAFAAGQIVGRIKATEPAERERAVEAFGDFEEAKRFWPKKP